MRWFVILPVIVAVPVRLLSAADLVTRFGFTKPITVWNPGGPNSWKYTGSLTPAKASWAGVPSSVCVCHQISPAPCRAAAGWAITS